MEYHSRRTKDWKCTHVPWTAFCSFSLQHVNLFFLGPCYLSLFLYSFILHILLYTVSVYFNLFFFVLSHLPASSFPVSCVCVERSFRCCAAFRQSKSNVYVVRAFPLIIMGLLRAPHIVEHIWKFYIRPIYVQSMRWIK